MGCEMIEKFVFPTEYPTYYSKLGGLRRKVACDLPIAPGMHILDVATGSGYFALEIAGRDRTLKVTGIDLVQDDIAVGKENVKDLGFEGQIELIAMDATEMAFPDGSFDMAVNFLGLEDIYMTRGHEGVRVTFKEISRVLKPGGCFCLVTMPPEEMESEAQKLESAVFAYICDAEWLSAAEYEGMLKEAGFELFKRGRYYTGKKLTPEQAKEEIKFACVNVPKIYSIETPIFQDVWKRYGKKIEEHGLGHCSKVVAFVAKKTDTVRQPSASSGTTT